MSKKLTRRQMLKLLGLASASAVLAACAPTGVEETAEVEKGVEETAVVDTPVPQAPVTVTFIEMLFGIPQIQDVIDPVYEEMSRRMQDDGLNITFRGLILDDRGNKYPLMYASGEDFTCAFDAPWGQMVPLREQDYLVPIEDLLQEYGPNIINTVTQEILDANIWFEHTYGIPAHGYYNKTGGVIIREDLRIKYDVPDLDGTQSYEGLEPFLQAIQENEPDMIPLGIVTGNPIPMNGEHWPNVAVAPGGVGFGCSVPDVWNDTTFVNAEELDYVTRSCDVIRKWWELGYVNKVELSGTSTGDVANNYFMVNKCAAYGEVEPELKAWQLVQDKLTEAVPEGIARGYDMSGQRAGVVKKQRRLRANNFIVFNANAPSEQHIAGIQVWNWITANQDNTDLWMMGIEGTHWKKEPNMRFSEVEGVDPGRNYRRLWFVGGVPAKVQRMANAMPKDAEEALNFYTTAENFRFYPHEGFSADTKPLETEIAAIRAASDEAAYGLKLGQMTTEEGLAKYKQIMDDAGRQKVRQDIQAQFDAWIAENL